uniref:Uncharacterized protein n=1 Tax=viral metagenome TaxID=1070528 RepID=A0A6C0LRH0_9ZZZZ
MTTFTFTLPAFGDRKFTAHTQSVYHSLGDESDLYQYKGHINEMFALFRIEAKAHDMKPKDYFLSKYEPLAAAIQGKRFAAGVWCEALRKDRFNELHEYYENAMIKKVKTDTNILVGDIVYIETTYETRQYYGLHIVVLDADGNKSLYMYGDGIRLGSLDKQTVKTLLDHNATFFKKADKDALTDIIYDFDAGSHDDWLNKDLRAEIYDST